MYEPTYWKDEVVENPYRYKETQNSDGSIEHVPYPGEQNRVPRTLIIWSRVFWKLMK